MTDIAQVKDKIAAIEELRVIYGYHGDTNGEFCKLFELAENNSARTFGTTFKDVIMVHVTQGLTDQEIRDYCQAGRVFFTWCDSDRRGATHMGRDLGTRTKLI